MFFCLWKKTKHDREYAADIAPVINVSVDLLKNPGSPEAKKAAEQLRSFSNDPADQNWKKLADELKKLVPEEKNDEKN